MRTVSNSNLDFLEKLSKSSDSAINTELLEIYKQKLENTYKLQAAWNKRSLSDLAHLKGYDKIAFFSVGNSIDKDIEDLKKAITRIEENLKKSKIKNSNNINNNSGKKPIEKKTTPPPTKFTISQSEKEVDDKKSKLEILEKTTFWYSQISSLANSKGTTNLGLKKLLVDIENQNFSINKLNINKKPNAAALKEENFKLNELYRKLFIYFNGTIPYNTIRSIKSKNHLDYTIDINTEMIKVQKLSLQRQTLKLNDLKKDYERANTLPIPINSNNKSLFGKFKNWIKSIIAPSTPKDTSTIVTIYQNTPAPELKPPKITNQPVIEKTIKKEPLSTSKNITYKNVSRETFLETLRNYNKNAYTQNQPSKYIQDKLNKRTNVQFNNPALGYRGRA